MKTLILALTLAALTCRAEIVTLSIWGPSRPTDSVTIDATQVAEVKSFFDAQAGPTTDGRCYLQIAGSNAFFTVFEWNLRPSYPAYHGPIAIRGPATITLTRTVEDPLAVGFVTLEITPGAFPPDKSVTIGPGPGGARITLECSTDLVNWTAATNGVYTNLPSAKFFRIRAERVP